MGALGGLSPLRFDAYAVNLYAMLLWNVPAVKVNTVCMNMCEQEGLQREGTAVKYFSSPITSVP